MVALQLVRMRAGLRLNSAEVLRKCFLRAAFEVALLPVQSSEEEYACSKYFTGSQRLLLGLGNIFTTQQSNVPSKDSSTMQYTEDPDANGWLPDSATAQATAVRHQA